MKKRSLIIVFTILSLALVGYYVVDPQTSGNSLTAVATKGRFEVKVTTTGELRSKTYTEVMAPTSLRSVRIWQIKLANLIPEGTVVNEGDLVAELDKTEVMNQINEEQLNFQVKESEYIQTRLDTTLTMRDARDELVNLKYGVEERKLAKEQSIYEPPATQRQAEIEYEKAQRNYKQKLQNYKTKQKQSETKMQIVASDLAKAQAKLDKLYDVLNQLTIKAPKDGMLIYAKDWDGRKKVVGSMISTWNPVVAALPDLTSMESITYVNEVDIQKIKVGQDVLIGLDAQPEKELKGTIKSVASIGEQKPNSDAKVFEVVINVTTQDTTLRPAMTTSNYIITQVDETALFVPLESVYANDSTSFVYKRNSGRTTCQEVTLGAVNETDVVILKGLDEGDEVLLVAPQDTSGIVYSMLP